MNYFLYLLLAPLFEGGTLQPRSQKTTASPFISYRHLCVRLFATISLHPCMSFTKLVKVLKLKKRKATDEIPPFSRNDLACYSITNCDFVGVADKIAVILMMRPSFRLKGGILSGTLGLVHQNLFSPLTHSYCAPLSPQSPFSVPRSSCHTF
jgi:hypothetical protein